jgi:hypothetical protein
LVPNRGKVAIRGQSLPFHTGFTKTGEDSNVTSHTTLAAVDPGISTLLLVPLAVLLAVVICALTLVLAVAIGAAAMFTLRRASVTVLGSSQGF